MSLRLCLFRTWLTVSLPHFQACSLAVYHIIPISPNDHNPTTCMEMSPLINLLIESSLMSRCGRSYESFLGAFPSIPLISVLGFCYIPVIGTESLPLDWIYQIHLNQTYPAVKSPHLNAFIGRCDMVWSSLSILA